MKVLNISSESGLTCVRGAGAAGKTTYLLGMALRAKAMGTTVVWVTPNVYESHIKLLVDVGISVFRATTSQQLELYLREATCAELIICDDIHQLSTKIGYPSGTPVFSFINTYRRNNQQRAYSLTVAPL